jgi:hypothetical protein
MTEAQKPVDLDELERLAREATPGTWTAGEDGGMGVVLRESGVPVANTGYWATDDSDDQDRRNADFIAATNPQTVLALIARLRALGA